VQLEVGQGTNTGMIRSGNEDSHFADPGSGLFVVADGMGGHAAGEIASDMAVRILSDELRAAGRMSSDDAVGKIEGALRHANLAIYERTLTEVDKQGMGTTASVLVLANSTYLIGQVGDSRVYLLRDGQLRQLTKDHSYVQEQVDAGFLTPEQARYHPYSNVITRCVGAGADVDPDTYSGELRRGDTFLVASDGLTGMVDDRRLLQLLMVRSSAQQVVNALIREANGRGGLDNITAIVERVVDTADSAAGGAPGSANTSDGATPSEGATPPG